MTRATRALIDLSAVRHNLSVARKQAPTARIVAVIKANAYGHGMLQLARVLDGADMLAVATVAEALLLRQGGVHTPLLVLQGISEASQLSLAVEHDLQLVVHHMSQLESLEQSTLATPVKVWLKFNTGMHRLGFSVDKVESVFKRLVGCDNVANSPVLMSHFANADDREDARTVEQLALFNSTVRGQDTECSVANSAGILGWPESHADWVRPGIMLYGVSPFGDVHGADVGLRPVMQFESRIVAINTQPRGARIGYGGRYTCDSNMPVGVISAGYGDGYPRHAIDGTPVLVNGQRVPLVGTVSMDMICVDLRTQPDTRIGDKVILWGNGLPVEEIAMHAQTIGYELLCGITQRVEFVYSG